MKLNKTKLLTAAMISALSLSTVISVVNINRLNAASTTATQSHGILDKAFEDNLETEKQVIKLLLKWQETFMQWYLVLLMEVELKHKKIY